MTSALIERVRDVAAELSDDAVADGSELITVGCCTTVVDEGCAGDCENRR